MPAQILSTKLSMPPIRSNLVARPRLFHELNRGLDCGFVLISAPAGYGKSTLLSAWLERADLAFTWLSLDDGDNHPVRFLTYLNAALQKIDPLVGEALDISLRSSALPDVEMLLTPLVNELAQVDRPFYLVLDDYHLIQNQFIHQLVGFLIEHRPASMHMIISTRADPPLPLARLRAHSEMLELRQADMCFTIQEAADFLKHSMGLEISPENVSNISARTEGWIAGLQMAALSMQNTDDISSFITSLTGNHHYIFDYLLEEILGRQTPEIRRFLLYTSILDQLTAPLCDALLTEDSGSTPTRSSPIILEELEHANLFILPLDHERRWYRYHHLFSDLLRLMLEKNHPGLSKELHCRACRWYETQGMLSEALQHALSSDDMQLVAHIVSANVLVLVENDAAVPSLNKIDSLPQDKMIALPWLGIARAWIIGPGQIEKSEQILDAIERSIENAPEGINHQRLRGHIAAVRARLLSTRGDSGAAIAQVQLAIGLLPSDEIAVRAMCLTTWGDVLIGSNNAADAIPILEQALAQALLAEKPHAAMNAAASLANAYLHTGRIHDLQRVCLEALEVVEKFQKHYQHPLRATAEVYSLLARGLAEWGENEKAIQYARKGLMLSETWGMDMVQSLCLFYLGRALVFNNDWDQARHLIQRGVSVARKISPWIWQDRVFFAIDSLLDIESTDASEINSLIRQLQDSDVQVPALLKARLVLREGKPGEALTRLEQAQLDLGDQPSFDTVWIYALRALAFQAQGNERQALSALQQALELGEPENRVAIFVREGRAMEKLLHLALAKSISIAFVQRLLAAFESRRKNQPLPPTAIGALVEPLSEREMEVLKLLARGYSDKKIATDLIIARETVHKHLKNIYGKLDVHSRAEAIIRARELDLL